MVRKFVAAIDFNFIYPMVEEMYSDVHLRHKKEVKEIYNKRKETIERVFADAKEKHGRFKRTAWALQL